MPTESGSDYRWREPFGQDVCEKELERLTEQEYQAIFLSSVDTYGRALDRDTYLISGRRGAGKTALTEYLKFQRAMPRFRCIVLDQRLLPLEALERLGSPVLSGGSAIVARAQIVRAWTSIVWLVVMSAFARHDQRLAKFFDQRGLTFDGEESLLPVVRLVEAFVPASLGTPPFTTELQRLSEGVAFAEAKERVLAMAAANPLILAIDTAEQYDTSSEAMMYSLAALVECASEFNTQSRGSGIHIKLLLADEIFPSLVTSYVANTSKHARNTLLLQWRPKDLLRLVCLRLSHFMIENRFAGVGDPGPIWGDYEKVRKTVWEAFFPKSLDSRNRVRELALLYILRHTQLRPRQLIILCNQIAQDPAVQEALRGRQPPRFTDDAIRYGVLAAEIKLAQEIINSYSAIYPSLLDIVTAIGPGEARFPGNVLHQAASRSRKHWPRDRYDRDEIVRILVELGIVGRQRGTPDESSRIIEADFQYNMNHPLVLTERDWCVIHPMFCAFLNRTMGLNGYIVLPFPDHQDYAEWMRDAHSQRFW